MRKLDLVGIKFNRLTVISFVDTKRKDSHWLCKCDCGNETTVAGCNLKSGRVKSCGCLLNETRTKHNKTHTRLYKVWKNMKRRCYNSNDKYYYLYGGRGITVCDEWKTDFQVFHDWAMNNGYDEKSEFSECTIDRKDNELGYFPENCRWANAITQARNKRTYSNSTSGVPGVTWNKSANKWRVRITVNKIRINLGLHSNIEEAIKIRKQAEIDYWNE